MLHAISAGAAAAAAADALRSASLAISLTQCSKCLAVCIAPPVELHHLGAFCENLFAKFFCFRHTSDKLCSILT